MKKCSSTSQISNTRFFAFLPLLSSPSRSSTSLQATRTCELTMVGSLSMPSATLDKDVKNFASVALFHVTSIIISLVIRVNAISVDSTMFLACSDSICATIVVVGGFSVHTAFLILPSSSILIFNCASALNLRVQYGGIAAFSY